MYSAANTIWVLLGTALVFFMQAGFAMVETGFTRAKNAGNIIMKNLMDFAIGTPIFWILGFGIMFGATNGGFIGTPDIGITGTYGPDGVPTWAFVMFQTVFCATAATIVSGAMAERTKFLSYCLYSLAISAIVYPISGHWIWNADGWLAQLGFHDFAGSTAVHMVGGVSALIGAKMLGPRIGKYGKDGKPRAILGHSLTLGALGVFILWFCWFGFNGCSTVSMADDAAIVSAGSIFMTTNLAAACATVATMIITWIRYKKPDISMTLNGSLAGLVAITAGCDMVTPFGAACIGVIAAFIVVFGIEFIDKKLKIDDPVGAIGVHGLCGASGTILTGLFAVDGGVFYGGGFKFFGVQLLGVVAVILWVVVTMTIIFTIINKTIGLRVSVKEEVDGLDIHEHGIASAYADFMPTLNNSATLGDEVAALAAASDEPAVPVEKAIPVESYTASAPAHDPSKPKMTKLVIITNQSKFEALKTELNKIGIAGITVTQVLGCGIQKGRTEYYRGVAMDLNLLPKVKVETVISKVPVADAVAATKKALYTGHIGDGKIFIYDVENVIKVRTGEEGYAALQDE